MPRSPVTIRDVAARAGVSHQTVSRVINSSERVTPETRQRVEQAIKELNYQPNAIARSMAIGRTYMLGCFSPNLTDFTFASIIEGAENEARKHGFFLVSSSTPDDPSFSRLTHEMVNARRIEGLLVISLFAESFAHLFVKDFPTVLVGVTSRQDGLSSVSLDNEDAARQAVDHLLRLGHRRIAVITGPMGEDSSQDRFRGYQAALLRAGLACDPRLVRNGDWSATAGFDAVQSLIQAGADFTAIVAQNDRMAVGAIHALHEANLSVPGDVSVIGFDDMPLASYFDPPLTTMRQDTFSMGREAARLLIKTIEKKAPLQEQVRIHAELVIRGSTSPLKQAGTPSSISPKSLSDE
jgi:LacI family repressor for deo operon, udp, cdd, tsx, nupC, and nupG